MTALSLSRWIVLCQRADEKRATRKSSVQCICVVENVGYTIYLFKALLSLQS